jgi:surface protein
MFAFFGLFEYFDQGCSYCFLFLRVDCECNRPSFLGTVFWGASAFNGDLSQWDVAKVTSMSESKSIRVVENDLTFRELMLLCDCRVQSRGLGLVVMM